MPCYKCQKNKWRIGKLGKCIFDTLKKCEEALRAYYANKE